MKKRFYCLLAAVLMAGACICVPVAEVKAEDGYNIDSYDNDDWYDSDDSPTDMVLDLSNVTIDKTSQSVCRKNFTTAVLWCGNLIIRMV